MPVLPLIIRDGEGALRFLVGIERGEKIPGRFSHFFRWRMGETPRSHGREQQANRQDPDEEELVHSRLMNPPLAETQPEKRPERRRARVSADQLAVAGAFWPIQRCAISRIVCSSVLVISQFGKCARALRRSL